MNIEFLGNIILKGKMEAITGIHIGGSKEKLEIGGVDSPVLRDPVNNYPYIPGSSIKGKMRSLLAYSLDLADEDPPTKKSRLDHENPIHRVFGTPSDLKSEDENIKGIGPTRLIVRDAYPDKRTISMWEKLDSELLYTEYKPENTIDRITSAANPRFMERIVAGSNFNVEFIYGLYKIEQLNTSDIDFFPFVLQSLKMLEHSTIGGSGSRGYGKIAFKFIEPIVLQKKDYLESSEEFRRSIADIEQIYDENNFLHLSDFTNERIEIIKEKI